jgi:hypothetical protein
MQILTRTLQFVAVKHAGLFRGKPRDTERGRSLVVRTAITLRPGSALSSVTTRWRQGLDPLRSQQPKTACDRYACNLTNDTGVAASFNSKPIPFAKIPL